MSFCGIHACNDLKWWMTLFMFLDLTQLRSLVSNKSNIRTWNIKNQYEKIQLK